MTKKKLRVKELEDLEGKFFLVPLKERNQVLIDDKICDKYELFTGMTFQMRAEPGVLHSFWPREKGETCPMDHPWDQTFCVFRTQ